AAVVQVPPFPRVARPHGPLVRSCTSSCRRALGLAVTPLAPRHRLVRAPSSVSERRAVPRQVHDGRQHAPRGWLVRRTRGAQPCPPLDPVVRAQQVAVEDLGVLRVGLLVGLASARLARAAAVAATSVRRVALALTRRRVADRPSVRLGAVVLLLPGAAGHLCRAPRAAGRPPAGAAAARSRHDARLAQARPVAAVPRHEPGRHVALALAVAHTRPAPPPLAPLDDAPPARQPAPGPRPARQLCRTARRTASSRQPAVELVVALARVRLVVVARVHGPAAQPRRPRRARPAAAAAAAAALLSARAGAQRVVDGVGDGRGRKVLQRGRRQRVRRAVPRHVVRGARRPAAARRRLAEPVHARRREDWRRARPAAAAQGLGRDDHDGDAGVGARGRAGAPRRQPPPVVGPPRRRHYRRRRRRRRRCRQEAGRRRTRRERFARLLLRLPLLVPLCSLAFLRRHLVELAHHHPPERHLGRLDSHQRRRRRRRRRDVLDDVRLRAVGPFDRRPAHVHDPDLVRDARRRPVPVHAAGRPAQPGRDGRARRRVVHERLEVPRRADRQRGAGRWGDDRGAAGAGARAEEERRGAGREREEVGPPRAGQAREGDPLRASGAERSSATDTLVLPTLSLALAPRPRHARVGAP
ncbi:uncharacterized protein RHOBADRAFT_56157, partial [Rhodotorula graminis WP1]